MELHIIQSGPFSVNTIIIPLENKKCIVVDPAACSLSGDSSKITDYLASKKMECIGIVLTHSHFDHICGIKEINQAFPNAPIAIHEEEFSEMQNPPGPMGQQVIDFFGDPRLKMIVENQPSATISLKDGDSLSKLDPQNLHQGSALEGWKVIHTPGHTPGSICLYNKDFSFLISGDTIFDWGGYGRTDMAGGDETKIMNSIQKLHKTLPAYTKVYPGHDSFGFNLN